MCVLSGPATVIANVETASAFQPDGWSTESVSCVARTARTIQENHEKERAEHAYYSHIHDEVTSSDIFQPQGLDESENLTENTIPEYDQEDETEQALSDSLQTLRGAPWKNGKRERARKDWKEDNDKTTQDGPESRRGRVLRKTVMP